MMPLWVMRIWVWLKHHWQIPLVLVLAIAVFIVTRRRDIVDWPKLLREAQEAHKSDLKAIADTQGRRIAADALAHKRMRDIESQVREQFDRDQRALLPRKQARIRSIVKQFNDDPHALSREIEAETGVRVIVID